MRSQNNARHMADGIICGEWLVVKYIERGGNIAFLQTGKQRTGLDDLERAVLINIVPGLR